MKVSNMTFSTYLQEQASAELRRAFEDTLRYAQEVQKGELSTRDAVSYLAGRLKEDGKDLSQLLDDLLKSTK